MYINVNEINIFFYQILMISPLFVIVVDMELPKHSKKVGDRRTEDEASESIGDRDHRLNHVYQGSLRETGSTLEPVFDADDNSASTTSRESAPPAFGIVLIGVALHHLLAST